MNSAHVTTNRGKPALQSTRLLDQVRERIRYLHYSLRTEQAYLLWIRAFVRHHGLRHPRTLGGPEVESFLNALVNQRNISASTHKQALCALLFLYREVLDQDLPWMRQIQRPAIRKHVPAVLTVAQTRDLLDRMQGEPALVARVLYGCGLPLTEALKLRVKDVDFERHVLIVRSGKGGKDRVVMLPRSLVTDLHAQMARARAWWEQDRKLGRPGVEMPDALARKYPKGGTNWGWHWVFPADHCSRDPRSGTERRQHDDDLHACAAHHRRHGRLAPGCPRRLPRRPAMIPPCGAPRGLDAEVARPDPAVGIELRRGAAPRDAPALDDHMAIGELDQPVHVLVDHQDGLAGLAKLPQATPDLLADQLGEALGRFVQDEQPGVGHQRAPDREHLPLAARQLVAA